MDLIKELAQLAKTHADIVMSKYMTDDRIQTITFSELHQNALKIATLFHNHQIKDVNVLIALDDPVQHLIATIACICAGVVPVIAPYNPDTCTNEDIIKLNELTSIRFIISQSKTGDIPGCNWIKYDKAIQTKADIALPLENTENSTIVFCHPSLHGDNPIVMHTLSYLKSNITALLTKFPLELFADGFVSHFNLQHCYGFNAMFIFPMITKKTSYLINTQKHHEKPNYIQHLSNCKAKIATINNRIMSDFMSSTQEYQRGIDLSSYKVIFSLEHDIDYTLLDKFKKRLMAFGMENNAYVPCLSRYETGFLVTTATIGRPLARIVLNKSSLSRKIAEVVAMNTKDSAVYLSYGTTTPGYSIKILDTIDESTCAKYKIGNIYIESEYLPDTIKTRLLGFFDDKNELYITDHLDNICIINDVYFNLAYFTKEIFTHYPELNNNNFFVFKDNLKNRDEKIIVMIETKRKFEELTALYDSIIEIINKEIELQHVQIVVYKPKTLPHGPTGLDKDNIMELWENNKLPPIHSWQLSTPEPQTKLRKHFISLIGLSDKRKAEKFKAWLYAWMAVTLKIDEKKINDNRHLNYYGVGYIECIKLASEISLIFDIWIDPSLIYSFINLKALYNYLMLERSLDENKRYQPPSTEPQEIHAISKNEEALIKQMTIDSHNLSYNIFISYDLSGVVNIEALKKAWVTVMLKFENLHTLYRTINNTLQKRVSNNLALPFEEIDLSDFPEQEQDQTIDMMLRELDISTFHNENKPLWRIIVYKKSKQQFRMVIIYHKIILDYWSMNTVLRELSQCYNAEANNHASKLEKEAYTANQYALWENEHIANEKFTDQIEYWKNKLANTKIATPPLDYRPPIQSSDATYLYCTFNENITSQLKLMAYRSDIDIYVVLYSAYQILWHWYTEAKQVCILCTTPNRHLKEFINTAANIENQFILAETIYPKSSAEDLFTLNKEILIRTYQNLDLPFQYIMEQIPIETKPVPYFEFSYHQYMNEYSFDEMSVNERPFDFQYLQLPREACPIKLECYSQEKTINCRLHYKLGFIEEEKMMTIMTKYVKIITNLINYSHMPIQHILEME